MISQKIRGLFKNFYFLFFLCFVLWMTIIDSNGFINRYRLSDKLSELNSQKEFYVKEIDKVSLDKDSFKNSSVSKSLLPVKNIRKISKKDMILNDYCPKIEVNPETYEVLADGELITCEPAKTLPLAQRYFMY